LKSFTTTEVDRWIVDRTIGSLKTMVDLLFRLGAAYANRADMHEGRALPSSVDLNTFIKGYGIFRLAESMRLRMFSLDPLGSDFVASGHVTRTMIRVALKIENASRRSTQSGDAPVRFFGWQARRMADVLARHQFRHPRERASMLILEATIARLLSQGRYEPAALRTGQTSSRARSPSY
jgi:hypothetical protein